MASALERVNAAWATRGTDVAERRFGIDGWISDYLLPTNQVTFGGNTYPFGLNQTFLGTRTKEISSTLPGYLAALRMCPPAYAAQMVRALVLSQARFIFRNNRTSRTPGRTFGTQALAPLEVPWPNGTTGELLARMEWHAGLAGNAYVTNRQPGRLRVLRPDWVTIVYGSQQEPDDAAHALDGEIIGYAYCNGGIAQGRNRIFTLLPDEVAHWSPLPDPEGAGIGMSWITPAVREIQGDRAATDHKLQFFANGATPNLVVKGVTAASREQFDEIVGAMEANHAGLRNAYRTLYLAAGADATVVGANLRDLDLKSINGSSETRISMLSRVHPTILGASEGLQGSSLNAGNFGAARRMWADSWIYPTLQDVAAALAPLIRVPSDAELWTTTQDMPILREDAKDAADIEAVKATTINTLVTAGFTKDSIIAAVMAQDMSLLVDSGLVSVQLQPPGSATPGQPEAGGAAGPKVPPALRSAEDDVADELDEQTEALIEALAWFDEPDGSTRDANFEAKHHRGPGGRFATMVDRLINAIAEHKAGGGKGHPFDGFDREQLRRAAKARGITLDRGEDRDSIAAKLLADLGGSVKTSPAKKATKAVKKPEAPKPSTEADVLAGDFSGLKRVGEQTGFNEGGLFKADDGSLWYVKSQQSLKHAQNEQLAASLYQATGLEAPSVTIGKGTPDLSGEVHTATKYLDGAKPYLKRIFDGRDQPKNDAFMHQVRSGFAVDAWLANWDTIGENPVMGKGWDNIVSVKGPHGDLKPARIDSGGALLFRGTGGPKGDAFGPLVTEWDKFRDPTSDRRSSQVFRETTHEELAASVAKVQSVTPAKIRELVKQSGMDKSVADTLIKRRADLISRMKAEAKPWGAGATTGGAALAAAPQSLKTVIDESERLGAFNAEGKAAYASYNALNAYQDGGYTAINQALLAAKGGTISGSHAKDIRDIDRVMNKSKLTHDVIVYRGERNPARNFAPGVWSLTGGMEGMEWTFHAYASTSTSMGPVKGFASKGNTHGHHGAHAAQMQSTIMKILVPKGTKAIDMENGSSMAERELLLARGLRYRVVKDRGVSKAGIRELDVEVVTK